MKKTNQSVNFLLSDVKDEELRERLEHKFIEFETLKRMNVETQRSALRAIANAAKTVAEVQLAQLDFLIQASEAFDLITTEPIWQIRRRGDGEVVLECLVTEKDMQKMQRAQTKQMKDQIQEINGHDDEDGDGEDDNTMFKQG
jgi:hypothetical protein